MWQRAKNRTDPNSQINIFDTPKSRLFTRILSSCDHLVPKSSVLTSEIQEYNHRMADPYRKIKAVFVCKRSNQFQLNEAVAALAVFAAHSNTCNIWWRDFSELQEYVPFFRRFFLRPSHRV